MVTSNNGGLYGLIAVKGLHLICVPALPALALQMVPSPYDTLHLHVCPNQP